MSERKKTEQVFEFKSHFTPFHLSRACVQFRVQFTIHSKCLCLFCGARAVRCFCCSKHHHHHQPSSSCRTKIVSVAGCFLAIKCGPIGANWRRGKSNLKTMYKKRTAGTFAGILGRLRKCDARNGTTTTRTSAAGLYYYIRRRVFFNGSLNGMHWRLCVKGFLCYRGF